MDDLSPESPGTSPEEWADEAAHHLLLEEPPLHIWTAVLAAAIGADPAAADDLSELVPEPEWPGGPDLDADFPSALVEADGPERAEVTDDAGDGWHDTGDGQEHLPAEGHDHDDPSSHASSDWSW